MFAGTHFTYPQRDGGLSQPPARLSWEWVLNPGPVTWQSAALPTELTRPVSTSQDTHEIAINTSNLHLTSRVRIELESSLQGHLKAISKPTRGIERANHHTDLIQATVDSKRPPRGLIPKVRPRIPDTPGTLTIEWEDSLQNAELIFTEKLKETIGKIDQED